MPPCRPWWHVDAVRVEKLTERISLKVTADLKRRIEERARRDERSVNFLGVKAFELYLAPKAANKPKRTR